MSTYEIVTLQHYRVASIEATDAVTAAQVWAARVHPRAVAVRVDLPCLSLEGYDWGPGNPQRILEGDPTRWDVVADGIGRMGQVRVRIQAR